MQRRDEHDFVAILKYIRALAFQLPIRIVDEDENTWTTLKIYMYVSTRRNEQERIVHGIALRKQFRTFLEEMRA